MNDRKEETIKTYISTFTINLAGNEFNEDERKSASSSTKANSCTTHSSAILGQSKDITTSYREACTQGTYFQLVSSSEINTSQRSSTSSTFEKDKAYFEGISNNGDSNSNSMDEHQKRDEKDTYVFSSSESVERSTAYTNTKTNLHDEDSFSESSTVGTSSEVLSDSLQVTTHSTAHIKESTITTEVTQTTVEDNTTTESRDQTSHKPSSDRYGETDWYMDLLLRMQALDMKQQHLIVQYDFLGKLANENREGLKHARDWAQYESDMEKIEVY